MNNDSNINNTDSESTSQARADFMSSFDNEGVQPSVDQGNAQLNDQSDDSNMFDAFNVEDENPRLNTQKKDQGPIDWEARFKETQSKFDKLQAQNELNVVDLNEAVSSRQFLSQLMEDDEVFDSFVHERKPDLFKKQNISEILQNKLSEEFGDYRPTRQEADENPGGQAWLYFKRLDDLYSSTSQSKTPKALAELKAERKAAKEAQEKQIQQEISKLKKTMNWDDTHVKNFQQWTNNLSLENLGKMYNFALRTQRKMPNVTNASGNSSNQGSARNQWLNNL